MRIALIILLLLISSTSNCEVTGVNPINFKREFKVNIFNENDYQVVTLIVMGDSIESPFRWSVKLTRKGKEIYSMVTDDAWLNSFFGESGYMDSCEGYISCKQQWYFKELPDLVERAFKKGAKAGGGKPVEQWLLDGVQNTATDFLKKKGLKEEEINRVVLEMQNQFVSGGYPSISLPLSPVQPQPELMYVLSIKEFVVFWNQW